MKKNNELINQCHVNTNDKDDRFVGIKVDSSEIKVFFPMGFQLSDTEDGIRKDIKLLINILSEFTSNKESIVKKGKDGDFTSVVFPINAYMEVFQYYIKYGYYIERNTELHNGVSGKINWKKTFQTQKPFYQEDGSPIYLQYAIEKKIPIEHQIITQIHKYCVQESFRSIGWLYTSQSLNFESVVFNEKYFSVELKKKINSTFNDTHKRLFIAMQEMLDYLSQIQDDKDYLFGTNYFEYIWEKLIDSILGIKNKKDYFPKTKWDLRFGDTRLNKPLEPDSIMKFNSKVYVLDAKWYRFGTSSYVSSKYLPNSSDINKQLTYGEYIYSNSDIELRVDSNKLYNAFIMPFNKHNNQFSSKEDIVNIGSATGEWIENPKKFEKVQGLLIDVKSLLIKRHASSEFWIPKVAKAIEDGFR